MRKILTLAICILAAGCAVLGGGPSVKSLTNIGQITVGMSPDQAKAALGDSVVIGFEITDETATNLKPIKIKNPQRAENFQRGKRNLEVVFYFTHIRQADDKITDDELTPLVFEGGRLIGHGWQFLNQVLKTDD